MMTEDGVEGDRQQDHTTAANLDIAVRRDGLQQPQVQVDGDAQDSTRMRSHWTTQLSLCHDIAKLKKGRMPLQQGFRVRIVDVKKRRGGTDIVGEQTTDNGVMLIRLLLWGEQAKQCQRMLGTSFLFLGGLVTRRHPTFGLDIGSVDHEWHGSTYPDANWKYCHDGISTQLPESPVETVKRITALTMQRGMQQARHGRVRVIFEVFGGSCRLSHCFTEAGGMAFAVDHDLRAKEQCAASVVLWDLDLSDEYRQDMLLGAIFVAVAVDASGVLVWIAAPCNTATRAREVPRTPPAPRPLRSDARPDGLDGLCDKERRELEVANRLFAFTGRAVQLCHRWVAWVVENPIQEPDVADVVDQTSVRP